MEKGGLVPGGYDADGGNDPITYRMVFPVKTGPRPCPVKGCSGWDSTRMAMKVYVHFYHCHVSHRWELPGDYPIFTVLMVIYHCVERIWKILITPNFLYNIYDDE